MCEEISNALDEVSDAAERLREVQERGVARLQIALPTLPTIEPEITAASPRPLFTTEDDFVAATRRLVDYKKLNRGD